MKFTVEYRVTNIGKYFTIFKSSILGRTMNWECEIFWDDDEIYQLIHVDAKCSIITNDCFKWNLDLDEDSSLTDYQEFVALFTDEVLDEIYKETITKVYESLRTNVLISLN